MNNQFIKLAVLIATLLTFLACVAVVLSILYALIYGSIYPFLRSIGAAVLFSIITYQLGKFYEKKYGDLKSFYDD